MCNVHDKIILSNSGLFSFINFYFLNYSKNRLHFVFRINQYILFIGSTGMKYFIYNSRYHYDDAVDV